jgi:molecular chaperone GrpE
MQKSKHDSKTKEETVLNPSDVPADRVEGERVPEKSDEAGKSPEEKQVSSETPEITLPRAKFLEIENKAQQTEFYLDHLKRLQAEFENFRKRNAKEKEEFRKFVLEDFLIELIDVLDNFERALGSFKTGQDLKSVQLGVEMIYKQFRDVLARKGVESIESLGQPFDPLKHDAVSHEDSADYPPHHVTTQLAKGYQLHGKVIRPSKVKVSKESSEGKPEQANP